MAGSNISGRIKLNVGGTNFMTRQETLQTIPSSLLASLTEDSEYYDSNDQIFYFDRDPQIFGHVLNAYRTGKLHIPRHCCPTTIEMEMCFWKIPRETLAECCLKTFYQHKGDVETIAKLKAANTYEFGHSVSCELESPNRSMKTKIWLILEEPKSSKAATIWHMVFGSFVLLSTMTFILWAEPGMRVDFYFPKSTAGLLSQNEKTETNPKLLRLAKTDPHPVLFAVDIICIVFFLSEITVHVAVSPAKWSYFGNKYNVCNLVLVMIMCTAFALEVTRGLVNEEALLFIFYALKTCSVFRLLLLFKLNKLYSGLKILCLAMEESWKELALLALCYSIAVVIFGGLVYCADIFANAFSSIFMAMWWALITMTTVGYGDIYPTAVPTYIIGCLCATLGLVILALPIAVIASNFNDYYMRNKDVEHHLAAIRRENLEKKQTVSSREDSTIFVKAKCHVETSLNSPDG